MRLASLLANDSLGAIGGLAAAYSSDPVNVTQQAGALDACQTVLTTTSGGSIIDGSGNAWTLTADGEVDENGAAIPGGSSTGGNVTRAAEAAGSAGATCTS